MLAKYKPRFYDILHIHIHLQNCSVGELPRNHSYRFVRRTPTRIREHIGLENRRAMVSHESTLDRRRNRLHKLKKN